MPHLLSARCSDVHLPNPQPRAACCRCGEAVWLASGSERLIAAGVEAICTRCLPVLVLADIERLCEGIREARRQVAERN